MSGNDVAYQSLGLWFEPGPRGQWVSNVRKINFTL